MATAPRQTIKTVFRVAAFLAVILAVAACTGGKPEHPGGTLEPRSTTAAAAATTAPTGSTNAAAGSTPVIISPTSGTQIRATSAPGRAISSAQRPVHEPASSAEELLHRDAVPTTQECISLLKEPCYEPAQVRAAYNVDGLIRNGIDGTGQTVVIIVSFGSPTLKEDLAAFSYAMGLPDADVIELYPLGTDFKEIDPADTRGWAGETTLDAEWVHGIAPRARIVVLASPVSETEGVDGMPEFLALERYAVDNRLGSVISQSWGTSENLLDDADGAAMRSDFDTFYQQAGGKGITVVTASGDHGPLADTLSGGVATVRSADWPAGVPWITVVGGTVLHLNPDGRYGSEIALDSNSVASGSGISIFYDQPSEQNILPASIQQVLNGKRGEADVAALGAGLLLYFAATPDRGAHPGVSGGTSASAPIWAAIVALANQAAGKGLGNINPALYQLGSSGKCFHDVTQGTNRFRNDPGEPALAGWDFPTGWGSPDAGCLVPALAAATKGS